MRTSAGINNLQTYPRNNPPRKHILQNLLQTCLNSMCNMCNPWLTLGGARLRPPLSWLAAMRSPVAHVYPAQLLKTSSSDTAAGSSPVGAPAGSSMMRQPTDLCCLLASRLTTQQTETWDEYHTDIQMKIYSGRVIQNNTHPSRMLKSALLL